MPHARIHLIEGPVGAGKSTMAAQISQRYRAPVLNLDLWMATLFSPDRPSTDFIPWYLDRKARCIEQIWNLATSILASQSDVILELGLIQQTQRNEFFDRVERSKHPMSIYVLDAPVALRKERVQMRNLNKKGTYAMDVPDHIFDMANAMWEPFDEAECRDFDVKFLET